MPDLLVLPGNDDPQHIFDRHFSVVCPHCGVRSNISAVSIPRYQIAARFAPPRLGICYRCDACNEPIFLRFTAAHDTANRRILLSPDYELVERPREDFEFKYLPEDVAADFREALDCYSARCHNAFAAMCRRTVQSISTTLGAGGKDKVLAQLEDLRAMAQINEDAFTQLKQIVIDGHDGAHPQLPRLSPERAEILLELVKDVLYQLFVRKGKLSEAAELRKAAIEARKV